MGDDEDVNVAAPKWKGSLGSISAPSLFEQHVVREYFIALGSASKNPKMLLHLLSALLLQAAAAAAKHAPNRADWQRAHTPKPSNLSLLGGSPFEIR